MVSAPSRRSLMAGGTAAALTAPLLARDAAAAPSEQSREMRGPHRVTSGADSAAAGGWRILRGRKVGVVSNPTGILRDARHVVDSMAARKELNIAGVFGPEHGFRGSAQAGSPSRSSRIRAPGSRSTTRTAPTPGRWPICSGRRARTRSCSTSRTWECASTHTSGRCTRPWWRPAPTAPPSSSWTGPTRWAAERTARC